MGTISWEVSSKDEGRVDSAKYIYFDIRPYTLSRASISFKNSGTVKISSSGDVDVMAYLTVGTSFDSSNGIPSPYIAFNDDGGEGRNFSIECTVEANRTYYLWVCEYEPNIYSQVTVNILPPVESDSKKGEGFYVYSEGHWVKVVPYIYNNGWKKTTPCIYLTIRAIQTGNGWIKGT